MNARSTSLLLYLLAKIKPEAWDAIIPHGPKVSVGARDYLIALAIKGLSAELKAPAAVKKLTDIQKRLAGHAAGRLEADFDDDNWCGTPWPRPFPWPGPSLDSSLWSPFSEVMLNPQPLPPKELQKQIGAYLVLLSEATSSKEIGGQLAEVGRSLSGG